MEINARLIKEQRNSRAWTQQHLADVCGVSLRTVQRIERYGTCSVDTLMSLSAVLEMDKQQLLTEVAPVIEKNDPNHSKIGITFMVAIPKIIGIAVKQSNFESPELMFYK